MSDNNYNQETENLQNISDYINNNNKTQRQNHIDLNNECIPYYLTINSKLAKVGDLACNRSSMIKAKSNLLQFLNISDFKSRKIHTCHKCENDSQSSNFVCINPLHLYFGTVSENSFDIDPEIRKIGGKIGGKNGSKEDKSKAGKIGGKIGGGKAFKLQLINGTHNTQTISICPHCQKEGQKRAMKRWHFDNCKYNPQNITKAS